MKNRLPLTVISGYLGAGKTTMINRLLAEDHGAKLLVMVNDFGAINIDAALLADASDDTLTLTNGCVCCTMGSDLYMAIGDVLDRPERPDHLLIEASGIADPARIAQVALAEPDLAYGGIVTVVDAQGFTDLAEDPQIGPQIEEQVRAADLVCLSKGPSADWALDMRLRVLSGAPVIDLNDLEALAPVLLADEVRQVPQVPLKKHPGYIGWQSAEDRRMTREALEEKLEARPKSLFRFKGFVGHDDDSAWEIHVVGPSQSIKPVASARDTAVVGIGLSDRITAEDIDAWWCA